MSVLSNHKKEGICLDCENNCILHKSSRCNTCFKKFDAERAKKRRANNKNVEIDGICMECGIQTIIHEASKCYDCFKKKGAERMKKCRNKIKEEKEALIPESEKIPEGLKKCTSCDEIKNIGKFYAVSGAKCKECCKKDNKNDRELAKNKEIPNINYECRSCGEMKHASDFRQSRKKCKKCENEYKKQYLEEKKNKIVSDSESEIDEDKEYLEKKKIKNKKLLEKINSDIGVKLSRQCRKRIRDVIQKKYPTNKYIGCSIDNLLEWFSFCFKDDMTLENHGKIWHMDHVIPVNTFDLNDEVNQMVCFNWKNISPEKCNYNIQKSDNIDKNQIKNYIQKLTDFHKSKNMNIPWDFIAFLKSKI